MVTHYLGQTPTVPTLPFIPLRTATALLYATARVAMHLEFQSFRLHLN